MQQLPPGLELTIVRNKCDLSGNPAGELQEQTSTIRLSAKTGAGVALLRKHLEQCVGYQAGGEGEFMARRRHLDALERVGEHIASAYDHLKTNKAGELAAEELREAQQDLAEITGEFSSDDLLGKIFSSFCIGK